MQLFRELAEIIIFCLEGIGETLTAAGRVGPLALIALGSVAGLPVVGAVLAQGQRVVVVIATTTQ